MSERDIKKKNPFVLLAGVCQAVGQNSEKEDAIKIANTNNKAMRLHSIVVRYKKGLEDVIVDISSNNIRKTGKIISGELALAVIGAEHGTSGFNGFPILGLKPVISNNDNVIVKLKAFGTAINARDVAIAILAEEID